jgi:Uma2 family endonuclease
VDRALTALLFPYIRDNDLGILLGDTDTIFGEHDVRRPDMIYFAKARAHLVREDEAIDGPPDLCIEIVSPSSGQIDREDKFEQYAAGKVRHYWIVDPAPRTFEGFTLRGGKYVAAGRGQGADVLRLSPFPELHIPLATLWFPARGRRR